jgi:hypothetical protein
MQKIKIFLMGMALALVALVLETLATIILQTAVGAEFPAEIYTPLVLAVLLEEIIKAAGIWKISSENFSSKKIFFNSLFLGAGFASVEIFLHHLSQDGFSQTLIFSYLGLLLLHTATAAIFGYSFSRRNEMVSTPGQALDPIRGKPRRIYSKLARPPKL